MVLSSGSVSGSVAGSCLKDQGHIGETMGPMAGLLLLLRLPRPRLLFRHADPDEAEEEDVAVETTEDDVSDSNESPLQMLLDDDEGEEDC